MFYMYETFLLHMFYDTKVLEAECLEIKLIRFLRVT